MDILMNGISTLLIAIALAMDAFAVSITSGVTVTHNRFKSAFIAAFFFGTFQALMPVIGWFGGSELSEFVAGYDHWIAFGLLALIGGRMMHESLKTEVGERVSNLLDLRVLTFLAIATSIDALAVGITFAFLNVPIIVPVVVIGIVTFVFSFLGVYIGSRFVGFLGNRIEIIGGLILIGIGLKILMEDLGLLGSFG